MIELKAITEKDTWEKFIAGSPSATSFFQSWNWGEAEKSQGHNIHRLGFYDGEDLMGIGSAIEVDARRGKYLHFRNGPVLDWNEIETAKDSLVQIQKYSRELRRDFIRVSPLVLPGSIAEHLLKKEGYVDSQMHDVDAEVTWMLDLSQSEEEILSGMRKHNRYYIRKAEKAGVEIIKSKDIKDLSHFWSVYEDTFKRQGWTAYSFEYISNEFKKFAEDDQAQLFLAKYQGKYIAAAIFIYYQQQAYYHHSGSLTEFKNVTAPYLIQWESIREAKKRGMKLYNFFGISREDNPKHPWYGLTFFKKGFGGFEHRWIHAKDKPLKLKYWVTNYYERLERIRRGY